MKSSTFSDIKEQLEQPAGMNFEPFGWLKKNKICIRIIFEDGAFKDYYRKFKEDYTWTVKEKRYLIVPRAIIHGKPPTITYYYNNPMPIMFEHEHSKIKSSDLMDKEYLKKLPVEMQTTLSKTVIDSSVLHMGMTTNVINKMYGTSGLTNKMLILIIIGVILVICVILQLTGTVDFLGMMTGKKAVGM
jgi:hypothetical protein